MGYLMEIAINLNKYKNIEEIKKHMIEEANKTGCEFYYFNYELKGKNRSINRNHLIMTFLLLENEELIIKFIKNIKKTPNIYIESFGYDNSIYKLMYASKNYLKYMDDGVVKDYLKNKKNNTLYKQDSPLMKALL